MNKVSALMHKVFATNPDDKNTMQPKEAICYSIAGFGQNLICGLVGSYLTYYFTNGLLIPATTVGLIMLFTRLFDACNDPIMGSIVDRTRSKWGKCRPYLLFTPIPIGILTVAMFLPFPPNTTATIASVTAIYVAWGIAYTIIDVPYWGLATGMTSETNQRGTMLTVARLFCTVGAGIISLVVPNLCSAWLRDYQDAAGNILVGQEAAAAEILRKNFLWLTLVLVVVALPTIFIGFFFTKERYYDDVKPKSLGHNLSLLFKNKPLLLIILSGILGAGKTLYMYSGIYVAQYNLADVNFLGMHGVGLFTLITFAVIPGGLIASVLVPLCTKKFGKKNTYIWSHIIGGAVMIGMYFFDIRGTAGLVINLIGLVIAGVPQGFANIITYAMIADTVDYLEYKTGERGEGICFAMQTFMNKLGMTVGAAVSAFGLAWAGILIDNAATQTYSGNEKGLDLMYMLSVLIPGISMILSAIPFFFYKLDENEQARLVGLTGDRKREAAGENIVPAMVPNDPTTPDSMDYRE